MGKRATFAALVLSGLLATAAAIAVWHVRGSGDDARLRAFFTLPTRSSCDASEPAITIERTRFSAFLPEHPGLRSKQGKFLIVSYAVAGQDAAALSGHFSLLAPSDDRYQPLAAPGGPSTSAAGTAELLFDVPSDLGAAKLVFDNGCSHEEWLAP